MGPSSPTESIRHYIDKKGYLRERDTLFLKWQGVSSLTVICPRAFGIMPFRKQPTSGISALTGTGYYTLHSTDVETCYLAHKLGSVCYVYQPDRGKLDSR